MRAPRGFTLLTLVTNGRQIMAPAMGTIVTRWGVTGELSYYDEYWCCIGGQWLQWVAGPDRPPR